MFLNDQSIYEINEQIRKIEDTISNNQTNEEITGESKLEDINKENENSKSLSTRIKSTVTNAIDTFTGHGVINICRAESIFGKIIWSLFLLIFFLLNGYYMYNTLAEFSEYQVISSIKVYNEHVLTFPAVIFCSWFSNNSIKDMIVYCAFNRQSCVSNNIELEPIIIIGYGLSAQHDCIRFNGQGVSKKNITALLSVKQKGVYTYGLSIGFFIPENVGNKLKIFEIEIIIIFKIKIFFL